MKIREKRLSVDTADVMERRLIVEYALVRSQRKWLIMSLIQLFGNVECKWIHSLDCRMLK